MRSWTIPIIAILVWLAGALIFSACTQGRIPPTEIIAPDSTASLPTPFSSAPTQRPSEIAPDASTIETTDPIASYLVVEFSPTDRLVRRLDFTTPITGVVVLQTAGLELESADFGDSGLAICGLDGVGCPADNCFCNTKFWSYEGWTGEAWQPHPSGPSLVTATPGAIEGWRWGEFGSGSLPPAPALVAVSRAYDWLASQQDPGTGGYDSPSSSLEAFLALGANHIDPSLWQSDIGSPSILDYWRKDAGAYAAEGPANAGKLAVALAASGGCWPQNAVQPSSYITDTVGVYSPHAGFQAWAMLGTSALSQTVSLESIDYLKNLAQPDGGWEWNQGFGSDTNTTALVVQALLTGGESADSPAILKAMQYLKSAQNGDGGFPYVPASPYGSASDVNSTAYVIQAIYALGQTPITSTWTISGSNPQQYLLGMQLENGGFEWQTGSGENLVASAQAATALLGRTYPLKTADLPACP